MFRTLAGGLLLCAFSTHAFAWGDEGHMVVALIADHFLEDGVRAKVNAMITADATPYVQPPHNIATEATWADKYRDWNNRKDNYAATKEWHFVDIEIDNSNNVDSACFEHPALPSGTPASKGAAKDCALDKIAQFTDELGNAATSDDERRMALLFLLHFVGDIHQPLHSSDDHVSGGNDKKVQAGGIATNTLHHYWDAEFVLKLGSDPNKVAQNLIATTTPRPGQVLVERRCHIVG